MDQNNRKGSGGSNKNMMGIISIILWALIITLMINYFTSSMSTSRSNQIEYSQFVEMVENDEVAWVVMESNKYTIYPRPTAGDSAADTQTGAQSDADAAVTPIPGLEGLEGLTGGTTSGLTAPSANGGTTSSAQTLEPGSSEWKQMLKEGSLLLLRPHHQRHRDVPPHLPHGGKRRRLRPALH